MSAFRDAVVETNRRLPPRVVDVPASLWATTYAERPKADTSAGLRRVTERDINTARAEASRYAWNMHPHEPDIEARVECYNDALIRWALARALCEPGDASLPLLERQEDVIGEAFTPTGLRYLWSKLDEWAVEESPLVRTASDDDLQVLFGLLADDALDRLPKAKATAVRRYLGAAISELESAGEIREEEPEYTAAPEDE